MKVAAQARRRKRRMESMKNANPVEGRPVPAVGVGDGAAAKKAVGEEAAVGAKTAAAVNEAVSASVTGIGTVIVIVPPGAPVGQPVGVVHVVHLHQLGGADGENGGATGTNLRKA